MTGIFNTRILASIAMLVFVGAVVASSTGAFFNDTETSTGNTFTAGALDLKVDSTAHYNGMVCRITVNANGDVGTDGQLAWHAETGGDAAVPADHYPQPGTPCEGTWTEKDLGAGTDKFFNLVDIKPGDNGENTISLHVYSNDAWGRLIVNATSTENGCNEPETEVPDNTCANPGVGDGELAQNMTFYAWLDQGGTAGFQGTTTPDQAGGEGDNIWQCTQFQNSIEFFLANQNLLPFNTATCSEPLVILPGPLNTPTETHNIWTALTAVDALYCPSPANPATGHNNYGVCHGIADDGRMVGSTTYYFGLAWFIDDGVGNIVQTDSLVGDLLFQAVQHRNNSGHTF